MPSDPSLAHESPFFELGRVAGIDEVGRGALAGPVMVGVVALDHAKPVPTGLRDSKLLTASRRETMAPELQEWAEEWAVGAASNEEIDEWGIRVAIAVAADRALCSLRQRPHHILIDGPSNLLRAPVNVAIGSAMPPLIGHADVPATMLVKGDQVSATIAAAAVIAKVQRDALMVEQSHVYPEYGWNGNKGYGSDAHREAIRRLGPSPLHRVSWNLT